MVPSSTAGRWEVFLLLSGGKWLEFSQLTLDLPIIAFYSQYVTAPKRPSLALCHCVHPFPGSKCFASKSEPAVFPWESSQGYWRSWLVYAELQCLKVSSLK